MIRTTRSRRTVRAVALTAFAPVIAALLIGIPAIGAQANAPAQVGAVRSTGVLHVVSAAPVSVVGASTTTKRQVKFYVVRASFNGQPEFLFEIAQRFLGTGDRAQEIFKLNVGRQQPDGAKMVRDDVISPGWQLILPDDAKGNELQVGEITVADPTTAATTPAATDPPAADSSTADASEKSSSGPILWILGGAALLIGLVLIAYALQIRRNALKLAAAGPATKRTGPGRTPPPAPVTPAASSAWRLGRVRTASDPVARPFDAAAAWTVDRALRSLAGLVADAKRPMPSFYAVSLDSDQLRLRLAVPDHEPPTPWNAQEDGLGWSASLRALQAVPLDDQIAAPSPRLVTLGMDGGTRVLIDLGQATGVIAVEGHAAGIRAMLQGWITELANGPWADQVRVIVAGLDTVDENPDPAQPGRVQSVSGVREALAAVGASSVGWSGGGAVAGVLRGGAASGSDAPGVLVLGSTARGNELEQIQALAGRPDAGWAVVFSGRVPAARWRFTLGSDGKLDTGVLGITVQATDRNAATVSSGR
jgi:hypothetical protein